MEYDNSNKTIELWDVLDINGNNTGYTQERGWLHDGNYHLIVHIWIMNQKVEFLISKRTSNKRWPNMWGCTIGSAIAGDDSLATAIKEVKEELGISLIPENGHLFKQYRRDFTNNCGEFIDVWIFNHNIEISKIILQDNETCDAIFANESQINEMIDKGVFLSLDEEACPYINELFSVCHKNNNSDKF